jgi:hypothetical protein
MAKKKKVKAKIARVRLLKVVSPAEDKHLVTVEKEILGPMPELPADFSEATPVELTPDAPEPIKRHWYDFLTGE